MLASKLISAVTHTFAIKLLLFGCGKALQLAVRDKSRWGEMSYFLGGRSGQKDVAGKWIDGEASTWKPELAVMNSKGHHRLRDEGSER